MTPTATTIKHSKSGATCEIWDLGASVTSFKTGEGQEVLMVSKDAIYSGEKAIRGGIPIAFPQFSQPDKSMPQHGFARISIWKKDESSIYDNDDSAGIKYTLSLKDVVKGRGDNQYKEGTDVDCECVYEVRIDATSIETTFSVTNTSESDDTTMDFEVLLHTYYLINGMAAMDKTKCYVKGLGGYAVSDKITNEEYTLEADGVVDSEELNVDRVYTPPAGKDDIDVVVGVGEGKEINVTATGTVDGQKVPLTCVVWNPYEEKAAAMGDFRTEQYKEMLCCEPGIVGPKTLAKGKTGVLKHVTKVI